MQRAKSVKQLRAQQDAALDELCTRLSDEMETEMHRLLLRHNDLKIAIKAMGTIAFWNNQGNLVNEEAARFKRIRALDSMTIPYHCATGIPCRMDKQSDGAITMVRDW